MAASAIPAARVVVVTGANKGIGYYIAKQLIDSRQFGRVVLAVRAFVGVVLLVCSFGLFT